MKTIELKYPGLLLLLITCVSFINPNINIRNVIGIQINRTDSIRKIKKVFVIDRNGVDIKKHPDSTSETIGSYSYGESFEVLRRGKNWITVMNGNMQGFIRRSATGNETDIPLSNQDLEEATDQNDEKSQPYSNIKISLVSKKEFERMKKTSVNYFKQDTDIIKKHKRVTKLPLKKGFKKYTDKQDEYEYNYEGQYPILNKYIVSYSWYEAEQTSYILIDKTTGKASEGGFVEIPVLSKDKKRMISVHANDYELYAELLVSTINKGVINDYAMGMFKSWMPSQMPDQFWGADDCFYITVLPSIIYYEHYNSLHMTRGPYTDYNLRYLKIKITGPNSFTY